LLLLIRSQIVPPRLPSVAEGFPGALMNRSERIVSRVALFVAFSLSVLFLPHLSRAQDDAGPPPVADTTATSVDKYSNLYQGQFTPGAGFDIIRTERGTLNISFYGLFRYVNQLPAEQHYLDHLGRDRTVSTRNDINWHRTMIWLTGFFYDPKFRYNITAWGLTTTQQTLLFGNLRYLMSEKMTFGVGMGPNLTNRSLQGSWPFWAGSDRQMGEEFLRGGFSSAFWITGKPIPRTFYTLSVNNNISQLGVTASNDTRDMAFSGSVWWQPTTGEFGPRNGFGDLEHHEKLATQFGVSTAQSREGRYAALSLPPAGTQLKISDGVNVFDDGALADGVTVQKLTYQVLSFDAGAKYRGFSFQGEFSDRVLSDFAASGPLPVSSLRDRGVFGEAMQMVVPQKLGLYLVGSYLWDDFDRRPWEFGGGASFYPYGRRNWRLNLHILRVERTPTSSTFGYYTAGQSGTTISLGTDILL
jgi:hypothetical protein